LNYRERIDWAIRSYEDQLEHASVVPDDSVPCLRPYTGTEIFAEAFGCPVHRPDDHNPFARPFIYEVRDIDRVSVPDLSANPPAKVFEIADALRAACGTDAVMKLPDIQSSMGIAALVLDKAAFLTGLIDDPAAIRALAGKTMQLLTQFLDEWFARYGGEYVAHFPDYYMRDGVTLSEDEIGSVGNRMFEEYFLPDLVALSRRYGSLGIHCCADSRHHWGSLLSIPDLKVLNLSTNWLADPDATTREAYEFFAGRLVQFHHGREFEGEPWTWPRQVPPNARAVFTVQTESREQAIETAERLREVREETKAVAS
jgi:hypothetical protein